METNGHSFAPIKGKIPGKAINLGGHTLVLAPLNLDGLQQAMPLLDALKELTKLDEIITGSAPIVLLSLERNYDIKLDEVVLLLDAGNVTQAVAIVCGVSGLEATAPGEIAPAP